MKQREENTQCDLILPHKPQFVKREKQKNFRVKNFLKGLTFWVLRGIISLE